MAPLTALISSLSRNPAGTIAVREAETRLGCRCEFVLINDESAVVLASTDRPDRGARSIRSHERELDASATSVRNSTGSAVRVCGADNMIVALTADRRLGGLGLSQFEAIAAQLATDLEREARQRTDMESGAVDPAAVVEGQRDLVVVVDDQLVLTWCNPSMTTMLGWTPDQVVGQPISDLLHPEDIAVALAGIEHLNTAHEIYRVGLRLRAEWGEWIPVSVTGLDHSSDPRIGGLVLSVRSAEQHTKDLGDLQRQTRTDQLTGLPNRVSLRDRLRAVRFLDRPGSDAQDQVTACFVDLDRFKNFNDIHGHRVGDEILAMAAQRLQLHADPGDILARNGGDEFVLILTSRRRSQDASAIAEAMRESLAQPFEVGENLLHLTASVGLASQRIASLDADRLLQEADIALYAAKERGRDRLVEFDLNLAVEAQRSQQNRTLVREALHNDGLTVQFQPIVNGQLELVGIEALVRCADQFGVLLEPARFLDDIGGTSVAVQLDHHVFRTSCAALAQLREDRPDRELWVSCNIAPNTLAQGDFADRILDAVQASGVDPSQICVEITETAAFDAGPSSLGALVRLHRAGIQIALDDFGTGFSSLSHLLDLPLSKIKIDRSFIEQVHEGGPPQIITKGATELAQSLGCEVVAEGVETQAQLHAVQRLGIDLMQGWLFARSLTLDALIDLLDRPAWPNLADAGE